MNSDKVNLDKTVIDIKTDPSNQARQPVILHTGISFLDLLNEQLSFRSSIPVSISTNDSSEQKSSGQAVETTTKQKDENPATHNKNDYLMTINTEKAIIGRDDDFEDSYLTIDLKKLSPDDLKNIANLLGQQGQIININQINGFNHINLNYNGTVPNYQMMNFSRNLSEMLNKAYKTNRPVRIDFENKSSVIIKIDREGKLSAQFLSSDKVMEMLLRDNLYQLRAKFEEEGLPFNDLSYKNESDNDEHQKRKEEEDK
jgi:hypothetical protein